MNNQILSKNSNLEKKILNELQKNCRMNLDEIGKKCGCSRYKVAKVMKKFEKNNTILGYSAIINPIKINLKLFILIVKRSSVPFDEDMLKRIPTTLETVFKPHVDITIIDTLYVHGTYDWIITFSADNISIAKEFCNKCYKYFSKYIDNLELLEIVAPFRIRRFPVASPEEMKDLTKIL
jgi:Lrp/AsnC family leucine-responsive transcriptional regulator